MNTVIECPRCGADAATIDTEVSVRGRLRVRLCSASCGKYSTLQEFGLQTERVLRWHAPEHYPKMKKSKSLRALGKSYLDEQPAIPVSHSTPRAKVPRDFDFYRGASYYKRGAHGFLYRWDNSQWIRVASESAPRGPKTGCAA